jgi:putative endonuclease
VVLVEVKRQLTVAVEACATPRQLQRVHRAADLWLSRHESCRDREKGFDLIFILPWRWPQHLQNAL